MLQSKPRLAVLLVLSAFFISGLIGMSRGLDIYVIAIGLYIPWHAVAFLSGIELYALARDPRNLKRVLFLPLIYDTLHEFIFAVVSSVLSGFVQFELIAWLDISKFGIGGFLSIVTLATLPILIVFRKQLAVGHGRLIAPLWIAAISYLLIYLLYENFVPLLLQYGDLGYTFLFSIAFLATFFWSSDDKLTHQ